MTVELDAERTRAFFDAMCARYGTRVKLKRRSPLMQASGIGLQLVGVMTHADFMESYTTVWRRSIYPSFTPGEGRPEVLWRQIVVHVHEHQHVEQWRRDGFLRYSTRYLTSTRARALYEAEAYGCNLELAYWRDETSLEPVALARKLAHYGCSPRDIDAATRRLEFIAEGVWRATYRSAAVEVALELFKSHGITPTRSSPPR